MATRPSPDEDEATIREPISAPDDDADARAVGRCRDPTAGFGVTLPFRSEEKAARLQPAPWQVARAALDARRVAEERSLRVREQLCPSASSIVHEKDGSMILTRSFMEHGVEVSSVDKRVYEGTYLCGPGGAERRRHGEGIVYDDDGETRLYEGQFQNGEYHGTGIVYYDDGETRRYEGQFQNGEYHGTGIVYDDDGETRLYEGQFQNGEYHGTGTTYSQDNLRICYSEGGTRLYEGQWRNGMRHGTGIVYHDDGETPFCKGNFINSKKHGLCETFRKDGTVIYQGGFVEDQRHGEGIQRRADRSTAYSGAYSRGKRHGHGTEYHAGSDARSYSGGFQQGKRHGDGTLYRADGTVECEGKWREGTQLQLPNCSVCLDSIEGATAALGCAESGCKARFCAKCVPDLRDGKFRKCACGDSPESELRICRAFDDSSGAEHEFEDVALPPLPPPPPDHEGDAQEAQRLQGEDDAQYAARLQQQELLRVAQERTRERHEARRLALEKENKRIARETERLERQLQQQKENAPEERAARGSEGGSSTAAVRRRREEEAEASPPRRRQRTESPSAAEEQAAGAAGEAPAEPMQGVEEPQPVVDGAQGQHVQELARLVQEELAPEGELAGKWEELAEKQSRLRSAVAAVEAEGIDPSSSRLVKRAQQMLADALKFEGGRSLELISKEKSIFKKLLDAQQQLKACQTKEAVSFTIEAKAGVNEVGLALGTLEFTVEQTVAIELGSTTDQSPPPPSVVWSLPATLFELPYTDKFPDVHDLATAFKDLTSEQKKRGLRSELSFNVVEVTPVYWIEERDEVAQQLRDLTAADALDGTATSKLKEWIEKEGQLALRVDVAVLDAAKEKLAAERARLAQEAEAEREAQAAREAAEAEAARNLLSTKQILDRLRRSPPDVSPFTVELPSTGLNDLRLNCIQALLDAGVEKARLPDIETTEGKKQPLCDWIVLKAKAHVVKPNSIPQQDFKVICLLAAKDAAEHTPNEVRIVSFLYGHGTLHWAVHKTEGKAAFARVAEKWTEDSLPAHRARIKELKPTGSSADARFTALLEADLPRYDETGESVPNSRTPFGKAQIELREADYQMLHAKMGKESKAAASRHTKALKTYREASKALKLQKQQQQSSAGAGPSSFATDTEAQDEEGAEPMEQ